MADSCQSKPHLLVLIGPSVYQYTQPAHSGGFERAITSFPWLIISVYKLLFISQMHPLELYPMWNSRFLQGCTGGFASFSHLKPTTVPIYLTLQRGLFQSVWGVLRLISSILGQTSIHDSAQWKSTWRILVCYIELPGNSWWSDMQLMGSQLPTNSKWCNLHHLLVAA